MATKFGQEAWNLLFVLLQSNVDRKFDEGNMEIGVL